MARFRDWVDLANHTIRSLDGKDVAGLYAFEWPEARRSLVSDHEEEIDHEPRTLVRWLRYGSAFLFGLAKRLTPQRRILFVGSILLFIAAHLFFLQEGLTVSTVGGVIVSYVAMMLLVAFELIDKLKYRDELELARELQAGLIPVRLPAVTGFECHAFNAIANMVGGDLYDFVPLEDGRTAILFGDASGHGMSAGLVMAVAHASFRTQLEIDPNPEPVMRSLNRILCRTGGPRSFFAGVYLLLSESGEFEMIVAGHPPPLHFTTDGKLAGELETGSYPLGIKVESDWAVLSGQLGSGEVLVLYSDGMVEARNEAGQDYGFERVEEVASRLVGRKAFEIVQHLVGDWESFRGSCPIQDDLSIAVVRRTS